MVFYMKKGRTGRWLVLYSLAVAAVGAALGLRLGVEAVVGEGLPTYITFYPAIMLAAVYAGLGPGILATLLTVAVVDYWILAPSGFGVSAPVDIAGQVLFVSMGVFISALAERYRRVQARAAEYAADMRTKEALLISETRYRRLFEAAQDGILILDADSGQIVDVNPFLKKMLGYSHEELLDKKLWEIGPFKNIAASKDAFLELQTRGYVRHENLPLETKDGRRIAVEFVSNVYLVDHTKVIQCNIRDITARVKAEDDLRQNREDLCRAQAVAHIGSWRMDVRRNELTWSDESHRIFGIPQGTPLTYETFLSTIHPEDRAYVDTRWKAGLAGEDYDIEHRIVADGRTKWVREKAYLEFDENDTLIGGFGITQDITERKHAEQALEAAFAAIANEKNQLEAVMEALPVGVAILDGRGGNIKANDMYEKIWGGPRPEVWEVDDYAAYKAWWVGSDKRVAPEEWAAAIVVQRGTAVVGQEMEIERFDGTRAFVLNSAVPIFDARGEEVGCVVAIMDITERKQAEDKVRKASQRFKILSQTSAQLLQSQDPQTVIHTLCQKIMKFMECHIFVNYLVDEHTGRLHLNACAGLPNSTVEVLEWLDFGQAICGRVAQEGRPVVAEDIQESCDPCADLVRGLGIRAYACHPLLIQGRVMGTLSFGTRARTAFSEEDLVLMSNVTDQVAIAMERMRTEQALCQARDFLQEQVAQRTVELSLTVDTLQQEVVQRMQAEQGLRDSQEKLRALAAMLELTGEQERRKIACDLHDSIGQILSFASRELQRMQKTAPQDMATLLHEVAAQLSLAVRQVRTLSFDLSPTILYDLGLSAALEELAETFSKTRNIPCFFLDRAPAVMLAEPLNIFLYRAVRELLINVAKHAHAATINVSLAQTDQEVHLSVEDDGCGFAPLASGIHAHGFGLFSIRERLEHLGGRLAIESAPGGGTKVVLAALLNS